MVVAWVGGWHGWGDGGNVESALHELAQHELARRQSSPCTCLYNPTMTLQTCLQARSLKQRFVSCSRVKRNACKLVTIQIHPNQERNV